MRTKFLSGLILDQDGAQARALASNVKELFNRLAIHSEPKTTALEIKDSKPNVIFINLSITQRATHFDTLESLEKSLLEQIIIFGYADSYEPELVAHAIENGFHDLFVRPFDVDIIASKLNRFVQSDKTANRDLNYVQVSPALKVNVTFPIKLVGADENGLTFKGDHYISKGCAFNLRNQFVKDVFQADDLDLMVTKTWLGENWKEYFFYAEPKKASETTTASLRKFILGKT